MRVLLLYDCVYPESIGGVEHRNHQLALALAGRGHEVRIAGWASEPRRPAPGVEVIQLPGRGPERAGGERRRLAHTLRWAAAMKNVDLDWPEVVESANIPYSHLEPLALRCALARRPLVITWHELWGRYWRDYVGAPWPLFALAERWSTRLGTVAVAVSPLTAERVAKIRRRDPPSVVPNGIPLAAIRAAAATASSLDAGDRTPLVYAGRLLDDKRVDVLLRAVALMPRGGSPVLAVIGDGPDRARLEALTAELGLGDAVRFTGRLPEPEDVWRRLAAARVAVQPSRREGFGLFPLEAMACGLPVVHCSSPDSALRFLARDGVEGIETPPEPAALAAALERLLGDEGGWARLAAAASRRAEEHDWERVAARFEAALTTAIERRPPR
jgi:glycosyltransferase involved in cell wall biosynthesis